MLTTFVVCGQVEDIVLVYDYNIEDIMTGDGGAFKLLNAQYEIVNSKNE